MAEESYEERFSGKFKYINQSEEKYEYDKTLIVTDQKVVRYVLCVMPMLRWLRHKCMLTPTYVTKTLYHPNQHTKRKPYIILTQRISAHTNLYSQVLIID